MRIRIRAERKCGELLRDMDMAKGVRLNGKDKNGSAVVQDDHRKTKTLSEMGVTKDQSSKWQKLAAVPEDEFKEVLLQPQPAH